MHGAKYFRDSHNVKVPGNAAHFQNYTTVYRDIDKTIKTHNYTKKTTMINH